MLLIKILFETAHKILVGKPEELENLGDLGIDGRLILRWMLVYECVGWIHLAQNRYSGGLLRRW
jgi:hypothetical protein